MIQQSIHSEQTSLKKSPLARVVAMNEGIKRVIETACQVNLMALNAILLARRAGAVARGFSVLSNELRTFVRELELIMQTLQTLTADAVVAVSDEARRARVQRILANASTKSDQTARGSANIESVMQRQKQVLATQSARLAQLKGSLVKNLAEAGKLAQFGAVLARTASIEAAYGGEFAPSLGGVAKEFGEHIENILEGIDRLNRNNQEAT